MSSTKKTNTKASTKATASSSKASTAAKAGSKRTRETKVKVESEPVPVLAPEPDQDVEMGGLPDTEPATPPLEDVKFVELDDEPTPMDLEVEEPQMKKRKISNKQRKSNTIHAIGTTCEDLLSEIQKDLDEKKFTRPQYAERAARRYKKVVMKINKNMSRLNQATKPTVRSGQSGFEKPYGIKPELAAFFDWEADATKSRIEINSALCKYIRDEDLQNPDNRRMIQPNPALIELLQLPDNTEFNYAQMQKFISRLLVPLPPTPENPKQ